MPETPRDHKKFPKAVKVLAAVLATLNCTTLSISAQEPASTDVPLASRLETPATDRAETNSPSQPPAPKPVVPEPQSTDVAPLSRVQCSPAPIADTQTTDAAPQAQDQTSPSVDSDEQSPDTSAHPTVSSGTNNFADILTPKTSELFASRGAVRSRVGDLKGAREDFDKAIELNDKNTDAYCGRGYLKLYLGETKSAAADFEEAIKNAPTKTDAYCGRGQARSDLGDEKGASEDFDYAIKLDPKNAPSYIFRGYHLGRYGETWQAIADYDKTIQLDPTNALAYSYRASVRGAVKDHKGAIADLSKVLKFDPKYAWAYYWRGHRRNEIGDRRGAIADYNHYISLKPDDAWGFRGRGFVKQVSGNLNGAIADYTKAIALDPKDTWTFSARGFVRQKLGNTRGSIADYKQAAKLEKLAKIAAGSATKKRETANETNDERTSSSATTSEPECQLITDTDVYSFAQNTLAKAQEEFGKPTTNIKQLLIFRRPGAHCQTVMWDGDKGIFCIFMANNVGDNYFQGNLGHELVHLLNAKLCDPYIEGLCTVFGENTIAAEDPKRSKYRELVLATPFYAETYLMMKELKSKITPSSFNSVMNYAVYDPAKQWMHIETDNWLKSMPELDSAETAKIVSAYTDKIKRTMPQDGTYIFKPPIACVKTLPRQH